MSWARKQILTPRIGCHINKLLKHTPDYEAENNIEQEVKDKSSDKLDKSTENKDQTKGTG